MDQLRANPDARRNCPGGRTYRKCENCRRINHESMAASRKKRQREESSADAPEPRPPPPPPGTRKNGAESALSQEDEHITFQSSDDDDTAVRIHYLDELFKVLTFNSLFSIIVQVRRY